MNFFDTQWSIQDKPLARNSGRALIVFSSVVFGTTQIYENMMKL